MAARWLFGYFDLTTSLRQADDQKMGHTAQPRQRWCKCPVCVGPVPASSGAGTSPANPSCAVVRRRALSPAASSSRYPEGEAEGSLWPPEG